MADSQRGKKSFLLSAVLLAIAVFWVLGNYRFFVEMNMPVLRSDGRFLGFFGHLFRPWSFSLSNSPPLTVLGSLIAIALTVGLGAMLLRSLRMDWRTPSGLAMAYLLGFGFSGILFHIISSLHWLYTPVVWLTWVLLYAAAYGLRFLVKSDPTVPVYTEETSSPKWLRAPLYLLIAVILFGIFWNALFFEETYWDALILYLGYARMTFLEHGFPFKAEAQVGIGLGANYPHLYPNYGSVVSTMWGSWSTFHQRLAAPLAGLACLVLVHSGVRRLSGDRLVAALTVLALASTPHFIAFATYASDYAFAMLFCAGFAWVVIRAGSKPTSSDAIMLAIIAAAGMHLNFLMGIFWGAFFVYYATNWILDRQSFTSFNWKPWLAIVCVGFLASSPWYVRNYVLTKNPVYAFFPEIFTKSINVNIDVLRSAEIEWFRNGDGVGRSAELYIDFREGAESDVYASDFERRTGFGDRLRASWYYWVGYDYIGFDSTGRFLGGSLTRRVAYLAGIDSTTPREKLIESGGWQLIRNPQSYKMSLFVCAFFVPGLLAAAFYLYRRREYAPPIIAVMSLITVFFLYHYVITDFYLYQIIGFLPLAAIFVGFFIHWICRWGRLARGGAVALMVCVGIFPGVLFSFMNFKAPSARMVGGVSYSPATLDLLRNPGISPALMWRIQYGADPEMWDVVNELLPGQPLLTHENRHLVFDPSIQLVHLDDWAIQAGYDLSDPEAVHAFLRAQGIRYYLRVPNEFRHEVNARLGMQGVIDAGLATEVFRAGENILYELQN